jgi:arylformamidase
MKGKIIDLTIPIRDGMGRLGLTAKFERTVTFEERGWQGSSFNMFAHLGTHVDAPIHFIQGTYGIDQVPLDRVIGPAVLMDFSYKGAKEAITVEEVREYDGKINIKEGEIVIFRTDWSDKYWGRDEFFDDSPYVTAEVGEWMVEKKVRAGVFDFMEEDSVRTPGFKGNDCPYHNAVLANGIYNIEYVKNLGKITQERCLIMAMPLKLVDVEGAPARVIAIELEGESEIDLVLSKTD